MDRTLFAKYPAQTPAISPLNVEPITIPIRKGRTAGVNHAVKPSKTPNAAPSTKPKTGLFIFFPPGFYYASGPFSLTARKKKKRCAHQQVCQDQKRQRL